MTTSAFQGQRSTTLLAREIQDEIVRKDTPMRKAVSPRKRTAITLYYMSSSAEYRTIANLFGVSTSFVCLCIRDVCKTITKKLKNDFLKLPKGEDLREVMRLYKEKWGFPSCAGAIDGTHIPIQAPLENRTDYIKRKSYHSIVMQALVDSKYLFRDVVIGWPGSVHDARVLSNSELYNRGCNGQLFDPSIKESILGVDMGPLLLVSASARLGGELVRVGQGFWVYGIQGLFKSGIRYIAA